MPVHYELTRGQVLFSSLAIAVAGLLPCAAAIRAMLHADLWHWYRWIARGADQSRCSGSRSAASVDALDFFKGLESAITALTGVRPRHDGQRYEQRNPAPGLESDAHHAG